MKDFTSMMTNPLLNTNHISRYSGVKLAEPETLDTHIVNVGMLGMMLIDELNENCEENISQALYLEKVFHHDADEALTGDVTRTLKYHNDEVHTELQKVADETAQAMYKRYFNNHDYFYSIWDHAKSGKEGGILKIADMLDVAIKALKEVTLLNNMYALRIIYEVRHYLKDAVVPFLHNDSPFNEQATKFLLSYVTEALIELDLVWVNHTDLAEAYHIKDTTIFKED